MPIDWKGTPAPKIEPVDREMISILLTRVNALEEDVKSLRARTQTQSDQIRQLMGISERRDDDGK
jgi:hypothetical protein